MSQKFLSDVTLSTITAGSMLKLDANGKIVEAVDGTDYISTSPTGYWTASSGSGIYYSDDVRIGTYQTTIAPDAKLHVFDYQTTEPKLLIEDGNTGDASMQFKISTQSYTIGVDNSDSDKFVLSAGSVLGTGNLLEITSNGLAAFQDSVLVKGTLYVNNQEQIQQGATEKIATFQNLGTERGYFEVTDTGKGYFYADGFKTGATTVGFLKSDGTVESGSLSDFAAANHTHSSLSGTSSDLITITSTYQADQGEAVIQFNTGSTEIGRFDTGGYLQAVGFKTATAATGFLKADGTVDTSTYVSSSHNHDSDYVSILGGYYDSDFAWDGTHDFQNVIKVSGASATTTNTTALFYGTGGTVEKRDLGTAAFAATTDFDAAGTAASEAGDVQDNLDSLSGSLGTAAYSATGDFDPAGTGASEASAVQDNLDSLATSLGTAAYSATGDFAPAGTYADGTTYQTYGTGNNGWLMPDYNNNTSNFMRMYYDDGSREFRMYSNHGAATGEAKIALYDGSVFNTLSSTNISQFKTAYGWGNHASAGYATSSDLSSGLATKADTGHKYHSFSNGQQFYDGYGQNNYLRLFTENAVFDNFRFRSYREVEVSEDGVNWNPYSMNLDTVLDGREETGINITHETKKFRFTIDRSTGWPTTALFVIQTTWSNTSGHTGEVILETWDGSQWIQRDSWVYNGFQRGYNLHTTTQVHNGQNSMRVTILMDWDDASHNYVPLRRILLLSNYSGSVYDMKPFYWNYNRDVTFANQIYVSGGNSTDWNTAYGWGNHASQGYLTSVPSEYLTQTEGDARYLQSLPAHNHDTLYDAIGSADAVQTWVNEQNFATDAAISTAIGNLVDSAPAALDTLNELAAALGDDVNFSTTVATNIGAVNTRIDEEVFPAIPTNNNQLTNGAGYITSSGSITGNAATATSAGYVTNQGGQLLRHDNRTISPREIGAGYLQFGFTSFQNNNTGGWADFLHLRSYTDSSGGRDNLVMFSRSSIEMRIWQQDYDSTNPYEEFRDVAFKDEIPTNNNQLTNGAGYLTTSGKAADSNLLDGIDSSGFVRAYGTSNDNIDADWGQSFKTFDPIPSGTPPLQSPNIRTINIGESFLRRTQLAFDYNTDKAFFRRKTDTWKPWQEFYHTGNLSLATLGYTGATNANYITNNNQLTNGAGYLTIGQEVPSQASWDDSTRFYSEGDIAFSGGGNHSLQVVAENGNDAFMAFHIHGDHAVYFGLENSTNRLYTGGWSLNSAKYQIWDSRDFTSTNVSNWNTAYGWGNHASAGYASDEELGNLTTTVTGNTTQITSNRTAILDKLSISGKAADSDLLDGINSTQFVRSDTNSVTIGRHLDANTTWTNSALTLFLGWYGGKIVIGNNNDGGHDYASALGGNTIPILNKSYFYKVAKFEEDIQTDGKLNVLGRVGTWITSNAMSDSIGWNTSYGVYIGSNIGGTHYLRGNGTFTTGGSTYNLWHAGNFDPDTKEAAGSADAVNTRIDEEIIPLVDTKVSKSGDQVSGALSVGGTAAYDSANLALDIQGNVGIWGSNKLYFKITSDNYNTWSTSQYADGSTHKFAAQAFSFTNEGYSSSVFMNINSSGVGMSRNLVLGNEVYGDANAYSNWGARLFFNGSNTDAQNNYYIGTNGENYGGNYSKLDLRWHTGIRMGAQAGYGGIRFYDNEDLNTRIMSIGESDNNIRIDNNLWIGGAGGWITDLLAAKLSLSGGTVTGTITATGGINMGNTNITNVNHITINDAGYGEGIQWSNWMIYDSPDNLSNASGNFQISNAADSSIRVTVDTSGNLYPSRDRLHTLGKDTNRWQIVFCEILDSAGQHEKNLQNPEGEKSVGEYETGTVLVWKGGKNVPCTEAADHMRMGIAVKGIDSPLIQGAEPVLVTGSVNEGDYLVTSSVEGHAKAITPQFMRQHGLYDCVLGKALESAEGKSHLVKTWINI